MNTCICIYACLFICRHQRILWCLTQLWTIQQSAHPGTYSGKQGFTCTCIIVLSPYCRKHPLAKKKWSYLHFSHMFSLYFPFFQFIVIFLKSNFLNYLLKPFLFYPLWAMFRVYIGITLSIRLSVCPSISPSVHLSVCLSNSCLWTWFCPHMFQWFITICFLVLGNGCIDFSENLNTNYLSSEDVHLEFSFWLDTCNFSSFCKLFGSWTKFNLPMSSVWTSAMISARTNLLLWYTSAKI